MDKKSDQDLVNVDNEKLQTRQEEIPPENSTENKPENVNFNKETESSLTLSTELQQNVLNYNGAVDNLPKKDFNSECDSDNLQCSETESEKNKNELLLNIHDNEITTLVTKDMEAENSNVQITENSSKTCEKLNFESDTAVQNKGDSSFEKSSEIIAQENLTENDKSKEICENLNICENQNNDSVNLEANSFKISGNLENEKQSLENDDLGERTIEIRNEKNKSLDFKPEENQSIDNLENDKGTSCKNLELDLTGINENEVNSLTKSNASSENLCLQSDRQEISTNIDSEETKDLNNSTVTVQLSPVVHAENNDCTKNSNSSTKLSEDIQEEESILQNFNSNNVESEIRCEKEDGINNKKDHEGNDVIDPEIVNCNDIELVDLNEGDLSREKDINRIEIDLKERCSVDESTSEEFLCDILESRGNAKNKSQEIQVNFDPIEDVMVEEVFQENSEDESTVENINKLVNNSTKIEIDENICIIPDNFTSKSSSDFSQNKLSASDDNENGSKNNVKSHISVLNNEEIKTKFEKKASDSNENSKPRPTRNAAKLAGNKIKSLVLNDFNSEDCNNKEVKGEEEDHAPAEESLKMCAQCNEVNNLF